MLLLLALHQKFSIKLSPHRRNLVWKLNPWEERELLLSHHIKAECTFSVLILGMSAVPDIVIRKVLTIIAIHQQIT